jgi:arginase family enzyme
MNTFVGFYSKKDFNEIKEKNAILLYGLPFDRAKATPGKSKNAPSAIRTHSYEFSGVSMEFDITKSKKLHFDLGDFWASNKLKDVWNKAYELDSKILVLGGDHSITFDSLSQAKFDEKTAVIWLDSHADLADEYPSGVFQSHGTVFTNLKKLKKLKSNQMLLIGGHAFTQTTVEHNKIKNGEITFLATQQIIRNKIESFKKIEEFVEKFDRVYLSIDIDVLDQVFVPTLGTSEPFGLTPQLLLEIIEIILPKSMYADIVETQFKRSNKIVLDLVVGLIYQILQIWESS